MNITVWFSYLVKRFKTDKLHLKMCQQYIYATPTLALKSWHQLTVYVSLFIIIDNLRSIEELSTGTAVYEFCCY